MPFDRSLSQPADNVRTDVVSQLKMTPLHSLLHYLRCLTWNSASNLTPYHTFIINCLIKLRPNCINLLPLPSRILVHLGKIFSRPGCGDISRIETVDVAAGRELILAYTVSKP